MQPREAFKAGFLGICRNNKLTVKQAESLVKVAAGIVGNPFTGALSLADAVRGDPAMPLGYLGLPVLAGAGIGALTHHLSTPGVDEEDIKKKELIAEMRHWSNMARDRQRMKTLRS